MTLCGIFSIVQWSLKGNKVNIIIAITKMIFKFFKLITTSIILLSISSCGNTENKTPKNKTAYSSNFTRDNDKQIITDKRLNKIWQDDEDVIALDKNYHQAILYCNSLSLGGYNDWYLPKFNDMISMLNATSKSIDGSFKKYLNTG